MWIKLTAQQEAQIDALSATNGGNSFVDPRVDKNGAAWLSASIKEHGGVFSHYEPFLSSLPATAEVPQWPDEGV